jgi:flagellar hook-associated protein 2
MAAITSSGIGSGLDINNIVKQLVAAERGPVESRLNSKEALIQARLSAFGSLKSSLTNFQSSISSLANPDSFTKRSASIEDPTVFSAAVTELAAPGSYSVEVAQLATRQKIASQAYTDSDTSVGSGDLSFTVNGESFSVTVVDGADSLADIRDAVNSAVDNSGVSASIINDQDGAHLVFSATKTGVENTVNIAVTNGASGDLSQLAFDTSLGTQTSSMVEKTAGLDSIVIVDGFTQTSSSTEIQGMIDGVTLDLKKALPGESFSLNIQIDSRSVKSAIQGFVTNYNSLTTILNDLTAYDPETKTAGLLQGDSATRSVTNQLRREMSTIVSGLGTELDSLAELGITTGENNKLVLDDQQFAAVMSDDFDKLSGIFSSESGYAVRLDSLIENLTASGGILSSRTTGLSSQVERIGEQREALEARIIGIEARYQAQFSALDSLLGQLNSTGDFLTLQLANLPGVVFRNGK